MSGSSSILSNQGFTGAAVSLEEVVVGFCNCEAFSNSDCIWLEGGAVVTCPWQSSGTKTPVVGSGVHHPSSLLPDFSLLFSDARVDTVGALILVCVLMACELGLVSLPGCASYYISVKQ